MPGLLWATTALGLLTPTLAHSFSKDGCQSHDTSSWAITVEPSGALTSAIGRCVDSANSECQFRSSQTDVTMTVDTGKTWYPDSHSFVFRGILWFNSRLQSYKIETSEDGTTWRELSTQGPTSGQNWQGKDVEQGPVPMRYVRHTMTGASGFYGGKWGLRDIVHFDCGPITTSTTTTSVTKTTTTMSSTTTSTTTTSGTAPLPLDGVDNLLDWISVYEDFVAEKMLKDPSLTSFSYRAPKASIQGFRLATGGPDANVDIGNAKANLTVPASILGAVGLSSAPLVATVFDDGVLDGLSGVTAKGASVPTLYGGMNLNIYNASGNRTTVTNLTDPVSLSFEATNLTQLECAFYNETTKQWSKDGLTYFQDEAGQVTCGTTHFTFFAAVLRGIFNTFACTQLTLLTSDGIAELTNSAWYSHTAPALYLTFMSIMIILTAVGCVLDVRRKAFDDEIFLLPMNYLETDGATEVPPEEPIEEPPQGCLGQVKASCIAFCSSDGCKDACDDLLGRFCHWAGDARNYCDSVCSGVGVSDMGINGEHSSDGTKMSIQGRVGHKLLRGMVSSGARRQASASLGLSEEDMGFLLEDEDLGNLLKLSPPVPQPGQENSEAGRWYRKVEAWRALHAQAIEAVDAHWHNTGWQSLPCAFGRLLFVGNPYVASFLNCRFQPASLRVLTVTVDLATSFLVMSIFFEASGMSKSKANFGNPDCEESDDWGEILGRLIFIAIVSLIAGLIPGLIFGSFHARSFKKLPSTNCPEWKRQLRAWRCQDAIMWTLALLWLAWCIFFVCLFFANVSPPDMDSWGISGITAFLEDMVVLPAVVALMLPLLASMLLCCISTCHNHNSKDLLAHHRRRAEAAGGNWHSGSSSELQSQSQQQEYTANVSV